MNYLAHFRKEKHLNQYDVAKVLGVSDVTISKYETGKLIPSNEVIVKLSEILGIEIKRLFPELFGG